MCGFSQVCAEALLKTLELMSKLRQHVKDMETSFYRMLQVLHTGWRYLPSVHSHWLHVFSARRVLCSVETSRYSLCFIPQDQRIVTPLSLALTSHHRDRVQTGLSLLFEATPLPDFPSFVWVSWSKLHIFIQKYLIVLWIVDSISLFFLKSGRKHRRQQRLSPARGRAVCEARGSAGSPASQDKHQHTGLFQCFQQKCPQSSGEDSDWAGGRVCKSVSLWLLKCEHFHGGGKLWKTAVVTRWSIFFFHSNRFDLQVICFYGLIFIKIVKVLRPKKVKKFISFTINAFRSTPGNCGMVGLVSLFLCLLLLSSDEACFTDYTCTN